MALLTDVFRVLSGVPAVARGSVRPALESGDRETAFSRPERTLLYGAGWAGVIVAGSARHDPGAGIVPVGFLDDDRRLKGSRAAGLPILGDVSAMAAARRRTRATSVLITLPYSSGTAIRRVVDAAIRAGLSVRTVPSMAELVDGVIDARQARSVRMDDLLRGPETAPSETLRRLVEDSSVMVTGAGGDIGAALVPRLLALNPLRIALVDETDSPLRAVADGLRSAHPVVAGSMLIDTHVVDLADRDAARALVRRVAPSLILHVAALPETPARRRSAAPATLHNVGGTSSLVEAAIDGGAERFLLVSTDEALEDSGAVGMSLRLAEMVVRANAERTGRSFTAVRLGHLAGTGKDARDRLRHQLRGPGPVTVDVGELDRSAMTVAEAARLALEAAAHAEPGHTYRLDPGVPRRAGDVAGDHIRLLGVDPRSRPIKVIGRPPREVPHHQLGAVPTAVARVMRVASDDRTPVTWEVDVERFLELARTRQEDLLRTELARYVGYIASTVTTDVDESGLRPAVPIPVAEPAGGSRDEGSLDDPWPRRRAGASAWRMPRTKVPVPARTRAAARPSVESVTPRNGRP